MAMISRSHQVALTDEAAVSPAEKLAMTWGGIKAY
jgi:hypothetical protein